MYLLEKGRRWVEARTVEVADEFGLNGLEGCWVDELASIYRVNSAGQHLDLVFSPAWLVYCSNDLNEPMRGLVMIEIRDKLRTLKRILN